MEGGVRHSFIDFYFIDFLFFLSLFFSFISETMRRKLKVIRHLNKKRNMHYAHIIPCIYYPIFKSQSRDTAEYCQRKGRRRKKRKIKEKSADIVEKEGIGEGTIGGRGGRREGGSIA